MKVLSVREINQIIKDIIDNEIVLEDISVNGELSSFSITRNIAYFTLKDGDNLLNCVQFGAKREFNIGDFVTVRGNVKYYPKGGRLTFNAFIIELSGMGEQYKQFLLLKQKLLEEGLFDEAHKIPIPKYIKSIGVVTSKTGAVLQDIKNVTKRRNPNLDIYVYDAQVQGRFAVQDVIAGITYFDNFSDVDVIIVARGGGSVEDLAPFNDEELARIAYICNKPIISAVGHETDFSILDFVADMRAPTPSAAAELVTFDYLDLIRYVKELYNKAETILFNKVENISVNVNSLILDIDNQTKNLINDENLHILDIVRFMDRAIENQFNATRYSVDIALNILDKLNPVKILKSGYAFATKNGHPINYKNTQILDEIDITTMDANFKAKITYKEEKC